MDKQLFKITTIMIIILIIGLIVIFINFFKNEKRKMVPYTNVSGDFFIDKKSGEIVKTHSEEKIDNNVSDTTEHENIENTQLATQKPIITEPTNTPVVTKNTTKEPKPTTLAQKDEHQEEVLEQQNVILESQYNSGETIENKTSTSNETSKVNVETIISSDTETSNQDKQQVLSEIDDALQGLLEAVGKVPTVDEEKLNKTLESSEV